MEKGDCIILKTDDVYFALILHHSNSEDGEISYGFIIIGDKYSVRPTFKEIKSSKILGYKIVNKTSDLVNSLAEMNKENNPLFLYTGIKYDLLTIPETLILEKSNNFQKVGRVDLHKEFFPRPEFRCRISNYENLVKIISERISKKNPSKIKWNRYYDAFELEDVLNKK